MDPLQIEFSPLEALRIFFRHKGKTAAAFALIMLLAAAVTVITPRAYRSEGKLFLRLGRENAAVDPTATLGQAPVVAMPQSREEEVNSVVEVLQSRMLREQVVDSIGPAAILGGEVETPTTARGRVPQIRAASLEAPAQTAAKTASFAPDQEDLWSDLWQRINPFEPLSEREEALKRFAKRLRVSAAKKSNVISITYDGPTPELAQTIVNRLIDLYVNQHVRVNRGAGTEGFFAEQVERMQQRLGSAEVALRDLKNQTGVASPGDRRKLLVDRIGRLEDAQLLTTSELSVAEAHIAALNRQLIDLPRTTVLQEATGFSNEALDGMRQQLYALQLKEQEYLSTYKADSVQVREVRRQIDEAKSILGQEQPHRTQITTGVNNTYQQLNLSLLTQQAAAAALEAKSDSLSEQLQTARADLVTLNNQEVELAARTRDVELADANYRTYARTLEQAHIDLALEQGKLSNVSIVQPATLESQAVRPQKLVNLGLGFLVAMFTSIGLGLAAERFDRSFRSPEQVEEKLGLPTLVTIPRLNPQVSPPGGGPRLS